MLPPPIFSGSHDLVRPLGDDTEQIHTNWLHRPGNQTLSAYNLPLWNHPFKLKRQHYVQRNVLITRELADYELWTDGGMSERGRRFAQEASRSWIGPKEQVARPE